MNLIDYALVLIFFAGLIGLGFYFHRWIGQADDHFLAGRQLPPFILAAVVAASNINLYNYVGYTGIAYKSGVPIIWQEWTGLMAMVTVGLFVHPILRRIRVRTVPEFLEIRYNKFVRSIVAFIQVLRGGFSLGIVLYLSVTVAIGITGVDNREFWVVIFSIITVFIIMFTALGGTWSVAITDAAQFMLLLMGTLIILPIVMPQVGWYPGLKELLPADFFNFVPTHGEYNWAFILAIWLLGIQAFSTFNSFVMRSFAAESPRASALGWVLAGAVMIPFAFLIILPGLAASYLEPGLSGARVDMAIPLLLRHYMPSILLGLVVCGFMASQMSTMTGELNSGSVVFANDVYYSLFNRKATDRQLLITVRLATVGLGIIMIVYSYLVPYIGSAVEAFLTIIGIMDMPLFVLVIVFGLFIRRANAIGGLCGYLGGILFGLMARLFGWSLVGLPFADTTFISSLAAVVITLVVSLATRPEAKEKLERVYKSFGTSEEEDLRGEVYKIWPLSSTGRLWLVVHLVGQALFLVGVIMGSSEATQPWAAETAIGGMLVFIVGAILRLRYD